MKKQYIMVMLLLIGFGIVSTLAFELYSTSAEIPEAYIVSTDGTEAAVESIKIRPSKEGDRMIITLSLSGMKKHDSYNVGVELTDTDGADGYYDLTNPIAVSPAANGGEEYSAGYYETTYKADDDTAVIIIKLDKSSIWCDVDGMMITLADA